MNLLLPIKLINDDNLSRLLKIWCRLIISLNRPSISVMNQSIESSGRCCDRIDCEPFNGWIEHITMVMLSLLLNFICLCDCAQCSTIVDVNIMEQGDKAAKLFSMEAILGPRKLQVKMFLLWINLSWSNEWMIYLYKLSRWKLFKLLLAKIMFQSRRLLFGSDIYGTFVPFALLRRLVLIYERAQESLHSTMSHVPAYALHNFQQSRFEFCPFKEILLQLV